MTTKYLFNPPKGAETPNEYALYMRKLDTDKFSDRMQNDVSTLAHDVVTAWTNGEDEAAKYTDRYLHMLMLEIKRRWQEDWWRA